jgi:hypothetical protein
MAGMSSKHGVESLRRCGTYQLSHEDEKVNFSGMYELEMHGDSLSVARGGASSVARVQWRRHETYHLSRKDWKVIVSGGSELGIETCRVTYALLHGDDTASLVTHTGNVVRLTAY